LVAVVSPLALAAQDSPFLPDGFGAPPPSAAPASPLDRFEFRGVLTIGTETTITLFDTSTSKSVTLNVGETIDGLRVTDFRPEDGSVVLESGGQTKQLKMKEAKIVAMAAPPPPPPPQPGAPPMTPGQGQPGGPAVAGGPPMSDEEARQRMQRVAEEIRRRREMRRQMLEQQQNQAPRPANQ
jgi:hypothetical protein